MAHDNEAAPSSRDGLVQLIARSLCGFTLRPCPGDACKPCTDLADRILAALQSSGFQIVPAADVVCAECSDYLDNGGEKCVGGNHCALRAMLAASHRE